MSRQKFMITVTIALLMLMLAVMPLSAAEEPADTTPQTTTQTTTTSNTPQGLGLLFVLLGLGAVTAVGVGRWSSEIMRAKNQKSS